MSTQIITIEDQTPKFTHLYAEVLKHSFKNKTYLRNEDGGWVHTLCARSALKGILGYLSVAGRLVGSNPQILVPQWTCNSVHQTIQKICSPSNQKTSGIVGVMVYHQYGFKQKLKAINQRCQESNLFVIENSVNCFESFWKTDPTVSQETRVASIFSWSKLLPILMAGSLQTDDKELIHFLNNYRNKSSRFAEFLAVSTKFFHTRSLLGLPKLSQNILEMAAAITDFGFRLPLSSHCYLYEENIQKQYGIRKKNYSKLRTMLANTGLVDHLEEDAVPYCTPLLGPEKNLKRIREKMHEIGVASDIYHFDINRNVFEPNFKKTLLVPVHGGVKAHFVEKIGDVILSCLK